MTHTPPYFEPMLLQALTRTLDGLTAPVAVKDAPPYHAANDEWYVPDSDYYQITPEQRKRVQDCLTQCVVGAPNIEAVCEHLKEFIDDRLDQNADEGVTHQTDIYAEIIHRWMEQSCAALETHAAGQKGFLMAIQTEDAVRKLRATDQYYVQGFTAIDALYLMVKRYRPEACSYDSLFDYANAVAQAQSPDVDARDHLSAIPDIIAELKGEVLNKAFFHHLSPPPADSEKPNDISMQTFLVLGSAWAVAAKHVREAMPDIDMQTQHERIDQLIQPTLQRLYKSGAWECKTMPDIARAFASLQMTAQVGAERRESEMTRT